MESNSIENTIIRLCRQHPAGLTQDAFQHELESVPVETMVNIINKMLGEGVLVIFQDPQLGIIYKEQNQDELVKFKGLAKEDRLIYQLIEQSGNRGIWMGYLKTKSNMQNIQITKSLKLLEARKLIKCVPTISQKTKKVYMLYNLQPHIDIAGDVFYTGTDIDTEFIQELRKQCFNFISQKGYASAEEVTAYIRKVGISKVQLKVENVQSIIETLIFDGKVEGIEDPRGPAFLGGKSATLYRPTKISVYTNNGFTQSPCSVCPVFNECSPDGTISPATCVYLKAWLEF